MSIRKATKLGNTIKELAVQIQAAAEQQAQLLSATPDKLPEFAGNLSPAEAERCARDYLAISEAQARAKFGDALIDEIQKHESDKQLRSERDQWRKIVAAAKRNDDPEVLRLAKEAGIPTIFISP
jgi:hypothetical protein